MSSIGRFLSFPLTLSMPHSQGPFFQSLSKSPTDLIDIPIRTAPGWRLLWAVGLFVVFLLFFPFFFFVFSFLVLFSSGVIPVVFFRNVLPQGLSVF